jgi:glycosyltransferase involved in cell wall biosynthesis
MRASVIIPTYKRLDALAETLNALSRCDEPGRLWEAIVVDDGSERETAPVARDWASRGVPIRYFSQPNRGPASARNTGAVNARGEVLIFIDNDILVSPGFVRRHLAVLDENPGCWVVGRIVHPAAIRATSFGRFRDDCWEAFHASQTGGVTVTDGMTAGNLALLGADFHRLGGFDEQFEIASCEDWDLGHRARASGIRILYDADNVVLHNDWAVDLHRFCERQRLYSISDVLLWKKYGPASPRERLILENAPIRLGADTPRLIAKKIAKRMLATTPARFGLRGLSRVLERVAPDTRLSRAAYGMAVSIAIFRGVREGFRRYVCGGAAPS